MEPQIYDATVRIRTEFRLSEKLVGKERYEVTIDFVRGVIAQKIDDLFPGPVEIDVITVKRVQ